MTLDKFMLWRFRTTEGVLDHIDHYNMNECVFDNGSKFSYDYVNDIIEIENHNTVFSKYEKLSFNECTKAKLKSIGFTERNYNRHSQSYTEETSANVNQ